MSGSGCCVGVAQNNFSSDVCIVDAKIFTRYTKRMKLKKRRISAWISEFDKWGNCTLKLGFGECPAKYFGPISDLRDCVGRLCYFDVFLCLPPKYDYPILEISKIMKRRWWHLWSRKWGL